MIISTLQIAGSTDGLTRMMSHLQSAAIRNSYTLSGGQLYKSVNLQTYVHR